MIQLERKTERKGRNIGKEEQITSERPSSYIYTQTKEWKKKPISNKLFMKDFNYIIILTVP